VKSDGRVPRKVYWKKFGRLRLVRFAPREIEENVLARRSASMGSMEASPADLEALRQFAAQTKRAVLVTRRKDDGLQSSPMAVVADEDGDILTATRARNAKTFNLSRDPRAMVCLFDERFPGPWMHVEGDAQITRLPEAMPLLADYYQRAGHDDRGIPRAHAQRKPRADPDQDQAGGALGRLSPGCSGCTIRIWLPNGSRNPQSIPYSRATGSWVNSTPLANYVS
jgi:PPOX class probable F420-dependent enzyme